MRGSGWVSHICLWAEQSGPNPSFCRWETEAQGYGTSSGEVGGIARAADSDRQPLRGLRAEARRGRPGQCVGVREGRSHWFLERAAEAPQPALSILKGRLTGDPEYSSFQGS